MRLKLLARKCLSVKFVLFFLLDFNFLQRAFDGGVVGVTAAAAAFFDSFILESL